MFRGLGLWSLMPLSWLIIGIVTKLTRCVPLLEQELLTFPEHLSFSGVCVTQSLVLCVCFVDRCMSFCPFSCGHCVVCSSSIYGFWLPLWYFQTLLSTINRRPVASNWQHLSHNVVSSTPRHERDSNSQL